MNQRPSGLFGPIKPTATVPGVPPVGGAYGNTLNSTAQGSPQGRLMPSLGGGMPFPTDTAIRTQEQNQQNVNNVLKHLNETQQQQAGQIRNMRAPHIGATPPTAPPVTPPATLPQAPPTQAAIPKMNFIQKLFNMARAKKANPTLFSSPQAWKSAMLNNQIPYTPKTSVMG